MNNLAQSSWARLLMPMLEACTTPGTKPFVVGPHGPSLAYLLSLFAALSQSRNQAGDPLSAQPARSPVQPPCPPVQASCHPEQPSCHPERSEGSAVSQPWLVLTPTQEEADTLFQDMKFFFTCFNLPVASLTVYPDRADSPTDAGTPSIDVTAQRMCTLRRLQAHSFKALRGPSRLRASSGQAQGRHPAVVITTPNAALRLLVPPSVLTASCLTFTAGTVIDRESLIRHLLATGYRRVSLVDVPGEFSIRGGIVDIFSPGETDPYRIECLGDTVESIRQFDPGTQESTRVIHTAEILPAREDFLPSKHAEASQSDGLPDTERPARASHADGFEGSPPTATLLDYFPTQASPFVVMDRPGTLAQVAQDWWEGLLEAWEAHAAANPGGSFPDPFHQYLVWDAFTSSLADCPSLAVDVFEPPEKTWHPVFTLPIQSTQSVGVGSRVTSFTETLAILERFRREGPVMVVVRSAGQVGRLSGLFAEHQVPATEQPILTHALDSADRTPFYLNQGFLSAGFVAPSFPFTVVTEEEVFAKMSRHRPQPKSKAATFLSSLDDLNVGDYVVHVHHGVSRYRGLRRLSVQDFESDYLILEFAGRDTVYVPLDRLGLVQKYRAGDHPAPTLDALGGTRWAKTKASVKKSIEEMTTELVELYANRELVTRRPYQPDATLSHEFDAAFDYEETPDQLQAIQDILRDLALPKPMDRLVCGDVGYGKTEVAMRAAFQAVQDDRQVAVLVPTTILAQQHYETFSRRFAPFPVRVAVLSRFQSPKEVKALLPDLASSVVDIVIGTHRLLQKQVQFKNLGLVIIDEEQWFGVRHKERLKQLRTHVDVLTLTATPIPRTLHMAFSGVRDLSIIDTPPPGRLAIRTQVVRFNPNFIRDAVQRELARKGQVFYVHNRVETIERTAEWLRTLVPEARMVMAHGQMNERALEGVMLKFFHGDADLLIATAIIQSGLDVPRANTILVDRADQFGLAQLYQLRGRVGRAGEQAYAYFFFPDEGTLSTDAQKRLTAIQEFADLGSGFRIAAADLEIRGAGNLLGKQQSGNIAAVGVDLYMQMVEEAVHQMKGERVEEEIDPTLHVPVSAFIPDDYIEDGHQRLSLYKRLSASQTIGDLALLHEETRDRYGTLPEPVERLFEVMHVRLLAKKLQLASLDATKNTVTMTFSPKATISQEGLDWLMQYAREEIRFLSPVSLAIDAGPNDGEDVVSHLKTTLHGLLDASQEAVAPSRP